MKFPFYLDTNATSGRVETEQQWEWHINNVIGLHQCFREEAIEHLFNARAREQTLDSGIPCFGHYLEYDGKTRLRDWLGED